MLFSVDFPGGVLPSDVVLDTRNKMRDRLLNALAQSDGDTMLVDEVDDAQKELLVIDFVLDAESGQRVAMQDVHDVWVLHVLGIEFMQHVAGRLPRGHILWLLQLVEQRLNDEILGSLALRPVSLLDKTVFEHADHGLCQLLAN